jgi:hypothetical protein
VVHIMTTGLCGVNGEASNTSAAESGVQMVTYGE